MRFSTISFCLKHSILAPYEQAKSASDLFRFCKNIPFEIRSVYRWSIATQTVRHATVL